MNAMQQLTVGHLRKLIKGLPDSAHVYPAFTPATMPGDDQPAVEFVGLKRGDKGRPGLCVQVGLFYLDDEAEDAKQ